MIADFGPGRKKHADPDYALRLIAGDFMDLLFLYNEGHIFRDYDLT
jgi:hypothetical protein